MSKSTRTALVAALIAATLPATGAVAAATPMIPLQHSAVQPAPLPTDQCLAQLARHCYSPAQLQAAYNVNPLHAKGITGKGRTIVIVDSFGSPTVQHDLEVFDKQFGLPDTQVEVLKWGEVPPFDPTDDDQSGWAGESTLDVESAHAIAPGAKIVLVETGIAETDGPVGVPEMMSAINHLVDVGEGDVVSMSWGTGERHFPGYEVGDYTSLTTLRYAFQNAARHGVTLTASSGDGGGAQAGSGGFWPSSDPLVTAVGGTHLDLDNSGKRLTADSAWTGSGGYVSQVFDRPSFQNSVKSVVGAKRGTPDISMDADPDGGLWIYSSYDPAAPGWWLGGGTSQSSPLFAGVVALADQALGHRVGQIDNDIYRLNARHAKGIVDVTTGQTGSKGYPAVPGYDHATGVGTLDVAKFVDELR
ncbi:S53 family peptidase [Kutzneria kofuensis]|uniref:Subtilase family serine protease n=1 Tax=Kutzneria kofuensis TaxID=103725 RepID=A0A7W9NIV4_9PSEU|nr:S53 family peptidase [Kutzneria kofuensis]MBB5893964.1 subtilase family serine protease [Kutzneria kofuensis]